MPFLLHGFEELLIGDVSSGFQPVVMLQQFHEFPEVVLVFHLISRGDSVRYDTINATQIDTIDLKIISNDIIIARYKRWALTENADTLSYWTTLDQAYPVEFHYMNTPECEIIAWHEAIRLMKYPDSQCEIIVPSKQGFSDDEMSVTPYVYIITIKQVK